MIQSYSMIWNEGEFGITKNKDFKDCIAQKDSNEVQASNFYLYIIWILFLLFKPLQIGNKEGLNVKRMD